MPEISLPMPKTFAECREMAEGILQGLESEQEETKTRARMTLNRLMLLEDEIALNKDKKESTYEMIVLPHEIGKVLVPMMREQLSKELEGKAKEGDEEFEKEMYIRTFECVRALNKLMEGRVGVILPMAGTPFNAPEMMLPGGGTSGGHGRLIHKVYGWGIKSGKHWDTQRKAIVSVK